ncbi:hypothetical protein IQ07DRAFT_684291 [Pyrenochaeta sp. DS3sAY3a]|nr:hypothetical protein IQ07DRAFT_684291 [Pyrenochaeta sp. DS3sAY3a]
MVQHETARFQYLKWDEKFRTEKPYQILSGLSESSSVSRTNVTFEQAEQEEKVTDIRENPDAYSLDTTGFAVHRIENGFLDWFNEQRVESEYIPQYVVPFLRQHVKDATRIIIFDWHLRRNSPGDSRVDLNDNTQPLLPAKVVHVDQTPAGVVRRVRQQLGDDAERALQGRVRIINFWKPLRYPVQDAPLAVCDGSVVPPGDLVAVDLVRRTYTGETAFALPSRKFRWYYVSNQQADEVLLFKVFDSSDRCQANACPHASFTPSNLPESCQPRESIEVRALILNDA